ncbi:hydantoinase/oxoprolinase family protein [Microbacterium paludicola]|uniref:Hydantoinase/oxoprolinase family protein n=1 Tax=Microbacterium paludicola TaxID=300019 RepID=A0A4Y9FS25_9MICO|nr:hydantoinase/oxoprolinase family protein [Microbacterium paludicola]MBF0817288.1 hydantoinase/oxoprolinase family protein [Microbacterium paludicola]TFU31994.1 hydantoinase/oxoprolinase family protein [Microbacterium paludicola]
MTDHVRIAIDVGGTFTDVVKLTPATGELRFEKVPTTPAAPSEGVVAGFAKAEAAMGAVTMFNHGTTLGLNALLTRTGARTAVVSTRGFRDVYLLGRTDRKPMYDIRYRKPQALLERADTFEVAERSAFDGTVLLPLDEDDARAVAAQVRDGGYASAAVSFLHSYANPAHEQRMREILAEIAPDVAVTISSDLAREYREYERTSTAVLDAYIKPIVRSYLEALEGELVDDGFSGRFLMSRSGGGAMTATAAKEQPVNLILSGPAGGVIGAAGFSRLVGVPNLITIDMGGTSLDASLVLDHEPLMYHGAEFEGMPIMTPSLRIETIGAGGGSLGYLDAAGALQVGPQSAGAVPGPASYGRGGTQPTFTDAALAVGYLGSDTPLGGTLVLDEDTAIAALSPIAAQLGLEARALARGMLRISTTKITGAVRGITVELGLDPKDFALLSFGGGGGLVAIDVARELGIPTVIVPPGQGAFSALGMLMADVQHDFSQTSIVPLLDADTAELSAAFTTLEEQAHAALEDEGFPGPQRRLHRTLDVRYQGQEHSVSVTCPELDDDFVGQVEEAFAELHERQYGHVMTDPVEITTLRVRGVGAIDKPSLPLASRRDDGDVPRIGDRVVHLSDGTDVVYGLYSRELLLAGDRISGPAVITEHTATTVIHAGDVLTVGSYGELNIAVETEPSLSATATLEEITR